MLQIVNILRELYLKYVIETVDKNIRFKTISIIYCCYLLCYIWSSCFDICKTVRYFSKFPRMLFIKLGIFKKIKFILSLYDFYYLVHIFILIYKCHLQSILFGFHFIYRSLILLFQLLNTFIYLFIYFMAVNILITILSWYYFWIIFYDT